MNKTQCAVYGAWHSPISAELVGEAMHQISQIQVDRGSVYWVEQFPEQKGRCGVVRRDKQGEIKEMTPRDFSVRNRVHEYGGGDYLVRDGVLYYCNDRDQKLYRQDPNGVVCALTPDPNCAMGLRYADLAVTPDQAYLVCVRETHGDNQQIINEVVAVATDGSGRINVLASGFDFFAAPRISPNGSALLYLCWNHPLMPWDGTELCLVEFAEGAVQGDVCVIAGGKQESICQPSFDQSGDVYFVSDRTDWWNLYKYSHGNTEHLLRMDAEFGYPAWIFGTKMYEVVDYGRVVCLINQKGHYDLGLIEHGEFKKINTPYTEFSPCLAVSKGKVYVIAANPALAPAVIEVDLASEHVSVVHSSSSLMIDAGYISMPEIINFPTEDGLTAYANFYPPRSPHFHAVPTELPPLIVMSHGGPTAAASLALNLKIQFWTSRGFAVVDVNYGGSTGYGRAYRDRLKGQWGIVDVADCVNAAKYLVEQKRVDPKRLIIKGSSAGGLTTLNALIFYDLFSAGASYYGVADLEGIATDSHKFESHYLESLIGPYPSALEVYKARSPLFHADLLTCPVIFFQGLEDKVVPPAQAQKMMEALAKKQLPYAFVEFPSEQHGFRDSMNIKAALEAELSFYAQIFGFKLADPLQSVNIHYLSA